MYFFCETWGYSLTKFIIDSFSSSFNIFGCFFLVAQNGFRDDSENVDEQRKWLDEEVEKALKQQKLLKQLEEALRAREAAVIRREETLKRKNVLETKKMRSSRVLM